MGPQQETKVWLSICKWDEHENAYVLPGMSGRIGRRRRCRHGGVIVAARFLSGYEKDGVSNVRWSMSGSLFLYALSIFILGCC